MTAALADRRFHLGFVPLDRVTFDEAVEAIRNLVVTDRGGAVFTPNVDHFVLANDDHAFRRAYADVELSVADGMPVVWASHLLGKAVPEKISGSDLVPRVLGLAEAEGFSVYLLGGGPGVAELAAKRLLASHPRLIIAGVAAPRVDMREPLAARESIHAAIRAAAPHIVLVCFGAPKQELFIHEARQVLGSAVLLGVGAAIDFIAGTVRRAPRWISAMGLEWAYRLACEPTRLWRRYLVRDPRFLGIVLGDLLA
jgi:N-acetylglucosaminyldiphosphoundecaprenol N-acetyl-beta-D-mannosaminyltransferase